MQEFQKDKVEPLRKMSDDTRRVGQALIQSAAAGVSTTDIEFSLQTMNTAWTTLSDRVMLLDDLQTYCVTFKPIIEVTYELQAALLTILLKSIDNVSTIHPSTVICHYGRFMTEQVFYPCSY